jgi:hypothetical protein
MPRAGDTLPGFGNSFEGPSLLMEGLTTRTGFLAQQKLQLQADGPDRSCLSVLRLAVKQDCAYIASFNAVLAGLPEPMFIRGFCSNWHLLEPEVKGSGMNLQQPI